MYHVNKSIILTVVNTLQRKSEQTLEKLLNFLLIQFHDLKNTFLTGLSMTKLSFTGIHWEPDTIRTLS